MADQKSLNDYAKGDVLPGGAKVEEVFAATAEYLIVRKDDNNIYFKTREGALPEDRQRAETLFLNLTNDAVHVLRGAYLWEYNRLLASCLAVAMQGPVSQIETAFDSARRFLEERGPIRQVFGAGPGFRVFLTKDGRVDWGHRDFTERVSALASELNGIYQIGSVRLRGDDLDALVQLLGGDLVAGFRAETSKADAAWFFRASRDFAERSVEAIFRSSYILSSISFFMLLSAVILFVVWNQDFGPGRDGGMNLHRILGGGFAGMTGAVVSVIQRGNSLTLSPFSSLSHVIFQGTIRVFLGLLFGVLAVVAVDAQLIMNILNANAFAVAIFCVAAGASERFIPDLLQQITDKASKDAEKKDAEKKETEKKETEKKETEKKETEKKEAEKKDPTKAS
jgi:hypothetical protein